MNNPLLYKIPEHLLARVDAGTVVRHGAILKEAATGQIVAHVQETGIFQGVLSAGFKSVTDIANPTSLLTDFVTFGVTAVQNEQIKSKLHAMSSTLERLNLIANIGAAASITGIGVTVVSTAILIRRMKRIDASIMTLSDKIDAIPENLHTRDIHETLRRIEHQMDRMDEAELRKDANRLIADCERALHDGFSELMVAAHVLVRAPAIDTDLLRALLTGLSACDAAQAQTLFFLNEKVTARHRSIKNAEKLNDLARFLPTDRLIALSRSRDTALDITR